jgi:hypothetical protein
MTKQFDFLRVGSALSGRHFFRDSFVFFVPFVVIHGRPEVQLPRK